MTVRGVSLFPSPARASSPTHKQRQNCWSCGRFVWARPDTSYTCRCCDVRQSPLFDPALRRRSKVYDLEAQRRQFDIDRWVDHGDPRQHLASPA